MLRKLFFVILLASLCLTGFAAGSFQESYRIGKSDVLKIEVPEDPEFSRESMTVSENGTISFPVLGAIKVEGLTVGGAAQAIREALIKQQILTQPLVTVTIKEYKSQPVTVLGEVKTTGRYYLHGEERLLDLIAEAGGFGAGAGDISISRNGTDGSQTITIKNSDILQSKVILQAGDIIFVRVKEASLIFISGEVTTIKAVNYTDGLTLSQAILMAGGLNRFGSKSRITIKRMKEGKEDIIKANLSDIEQGKAKDIPLQPNDSILVGRRVF
jgi:polysaccharide biosynthesis/export protein